MRSLACVILLALVLGSAACDAPGSRALRWLRQGDEMAVCGQLFHTGAPVVLWSDPGGYNAYLTPPAVDAHFGFRSEMLTWEEAQHALIDGWDLPLLQRVVDQFVIHYDGSGVSRECFRTIHESRGLSVHFLLDLDGTIYQTLDLQERAWHATVANGRSIGIEIANVGAYPPEQAGKLEAWYRRDRAGLMRVAIPARLGDGSLRMHGFIARPARDQPIVGVIQGRMLRQYDFTPQQYRSLIRLTAALCRVFPQIRCDFPRDAQGQLIPRKLSDADLEQYHGLLGHYHIQTNKEDPGPAFAWELVVEGARQIMSR